MRSGVVLVSGRRAYGEEDVGIDPLSEDSEGIEEA